MKIIGIETSCDETGAAIIDADEKNNNIKLLSNIVASSIPQHIKAGGIIPEIAAREQIKFILPVIDKAFKNAALNAKEIDSIAVTVGPGLIGSLLVGVETAKTLSFIWNKPLISVNHLFGHIYANWIEKNSYEIILPAISLIVSGGHTDIVLINKHKKIIWISGTRDDAAGEAFDKIGRLLGLSYPAGPEIERLAKKGRKNEYFFPRPLLNEKTLDFSFSGLKTAAFREIQKLESKNKLNSQVICDISLAVQEAIIDVLIQKTLRAANLYGVKSVLLSGGVAANKTLSDSFRKIIFDQQLPYLFFVPSKNLCTDNAAMIACAAFFNFDVIPFYEVNANPDLYFD